MIRCKLGFHKWGKKKQWVVKGEVVNTPRCVYCDKLKFYGN